jgi:peptidoglycan hydrolase-like amidase
MKKVSFFLFLIFTTAFVISCTPSAKYLRSKNVSSGTDYVRVLIKVENRGFRINAGSPLRVIDKATSKIIFETKTGGLNFYPEKIKKIYLIESDKNILYLNQKGFRGKIELHNVLGKIYIINILNIEEYLLSVVPQKCLHHGMMKH